MDLFDVFISYGRYDADMFIIKKIKKYLEDHYHTVWVDKEQIEATEDWREAIYNGIKNSKNVLGLLSNYSTRDRCVCLEELAIAISYPEKTIITIMLDPEDEVRLPSSVSRIQWIDFSSWKKRQAENEEKFNEWFDFEMQNVITKIDSKENLEFQGDITLLRRILSPDMLDNKFRHLVAKKLFGRRWAINDFSSFVNDKTHRRFLCVSGSPGCGKSHLAAHLAHWNLNVAAGYFIEWDRQSENSINEFIRTVAFLLATKFPDYRQALKRVLNENGWDGKLSGWDLYQAKKQLNDRPALDLMNLLVIDPISYAIDGEIDNQIIVIDGLDEAYHHNLNPLLNLLSNNAMDRLPSWLKFVITFRREPEIAVLFNQMITDEIDLDSRFSEQDIYEFLLERLGHPKNAKGFSEDYIKALSSRCEHSFIYAEKLCEAVEQGIVANDTLLEDIPKNISGLYYMYFSRLFSDKDYNEVRRPLSVIVANGGQITKEQLKFLMGWGDRDYALFMRTMKSFVYQSNTTDYPILSFFHKSIGDWLTNVDVSEQYVVDAHKGTERILETCYDAYRSKRYKKYTYDVKKFIYESIYAFASAEQKNEVSFDFEYLYEMQDVSYRNSDSDLSQKCFDSIMTRYELLPKDKQLDCEVWAARAHVIRCEVGLAEGKNVIEDLKEVERNFPNAMSNYPDIYISIEDNIMFLDRLQDIDQALIRCENLYKFIEEHDFKGKECSIGQLNYHHGVILYVLGKKDKEYYKEAIIHLERAISIANQFYAPVAAKQLEVMAKNQISMCYRWLGDYGRALEYSNQSLKTRIILYGKYSRYTSVGYDNLARIELAVAKNEHIPASESAYNNAQTALKIDEYIFGRNCPKTARHLQTLALICLHDATLGVQKPDDGLELAMEALEIFRASDKINSGEIITTENLIESLKKIKIDGA